MPFNLKTPILYNQICSITELKDGKVYLLKCTGNTSIIVKFDAIGLPQITGANRVMKQIDDSARVKVLSHGEESNLSLYADGILDLAVELKKMGVDHWHAEEVAAMTNLKQTLGFGFPAVKMAALDVRDLKAALIKRSQGDKSDLRAFRDALNRQGGLEQLGRIVTADLFTGNTDRFMPNEKVRTISIGGYQLTIKALINMGNVFIAMQNAVPGISGIDFLDPNSAFKDIDTSLSVTETATNKWPARILTNRSQRTRYARDIVHDLEAILHPKKHTLSLDTKLVRNAASRLEAGMVSGAKLLVQKLRTKYRNIGLNSGGGYSWKIGTMERVKVLEQVR